MTESPSKPVSKLRLLVLCAILAALPLAVYWQTHAFKFVNFDDDLYVTGNRAVLSGLSAEGVKEAFRFPDFSYWQPLTLLSHMADVSLFGAKPGPMHLENAFFHAANTILLFIALFLLTGSAFPSFFAAALFAVHPVNADTVAWISERKNLLSTFFWFAALAAYAVYAKKPSLRRMVPVFLATALGLLSKPMAVTIPFTLLLLDFWPLDRYRGRIWPLLAEKIPLFLLSGAAVVMGLWSTRAFEAEIPGNWPLALRLAHVPVAIVRYLEMILWPENLCAFHPFPPSLCAVELLGAVLVIIALIYAAVFSARRRPFVTVGILWFLGTLLPASGIVMGGHWAAVAERYLYVPQNGLFMAAAWGLAELASGAARPRKAGIAAVTLGALLVLGLSALAHAQAGCWKDSRALFTRAMTVHPRNYFAETRLGEVLADKGDPASLKEAESLFRRALADGPRFALAETHVSLGRLLMKTGRTDEARGHLEKALALAPRYFAALVALGGLDSRQGQKEKARDLFLRALAQKPDSIEALGLLGALYMDDNKPDLAVPLFTRASALEPGSGQAALLLARSLARAGRAREAAAEYRRAERLLPGRSEISAELAQVLTGKGDLSGSLGPYDEAVKRNPKDFALRVNLAQVLLALGRPQDALAHFETAVKLKPDFLPAREGKAAALAATGKNAEAAAEYRAVLSASPQNLAACWGLARVSEKMGCFGTAAEYYKRALDLRPGWDAAKKGYDANNGKADQGGGCP